MCLISLRWAPTHAVPLIIASNRDEYYQRSSRSAQCWSENPDIFAGKDLVAGGTWLGVNRQTGRIAALTNYREPQTEIFNCSRGLIVSDFLNSTEDICQWLSMLLKKRSHNYAGFNLLAGDSSGLFYVSNRESGIRKISPGIYGFSNGLWGHQWPKIKRLNSLVKSTLQQYESHLADKKCVQGLMNALHSKESFPDELLPDTGAGLEIERMNAPCFIAGDAYGTCTSTIIIKENSGKLHWHEQHYLSQGIYDKYYHHTLNICR